MSTTGTPTLQRVVGSPVSESSNGDTFNDISTLRNSESQAAYTDNLVSRKVNDLGVDSPGTITSSEKVNRAGFSWSDVFNYITQFIAVTAAVVFGVWAIRSYDAAQLANQLSVASLDASKIALEQSILANKLALLTFCNSDIVRNLSTSNLFALKADS